MNLRSAFLLLCCLLIWTLRCQCQILRPTFTDTTSTIAALAFSEDEKTVAVAYSNRPEVLIMNKESGLPLRYLCGHDLPVTFIAFDAVKNQLITANSREVMIWDLSDYSALDKFNLLLQPEPEQAPEPQHFQYDPSRQLLFRSVGDKLFCYSLKRAAMGKHWEPRNGLGRKIKRGAGTLLAQAPDRDELWALDTADGILRRMELEYFRQEDRLPVAGAVALAVNNNNLAVLCNDDKSEKQAWNLYLFDSELKEIANWPIRSEELAGPVRNMDFTGKGMLSIAGAGGLIDVNLITGSMMHRPIRATYQFLHFGHSGKLYLIEEKRLEVLGPRGRSLRQMSLTPGPWLMHDEADGRVFIFDGHLLRDEHGDLIFTLPKTNALPVSADLREGFLAVAYSNDEVLVYDIRQQALQHHILLSGAGMASIKLAPKSERLICLDATKETLHLLNLENGTILSTQSSPEAPVSAIELVQDEFWVVRTDSRIEHHALSTGQLKSSSFLPVDTLTAFRFSADAKWALLGEKAGVTICRVSSSSPEQLKIVNRLVGHDNAVQQLHFNQSGDRFLTTAGDGAVKLWETASGRLLEHIDLKGSGARAAFFLEGGPDLAIMTHSGTVYYRPSDIVLRGMDFLPADKSIDKSGRDILATYNRDGDLLATHISGNPWLEIWETTSGARLHRIPVPDKIEVNQFSFFGEQDILLVAGDCQFAYWDARSGQVLKNVNYCMAGLRLAGLQKKPGGNELWAVQRDGDQLYIFDSRSGDLRLTIPVRRPRDEAKVRFQGLHFSDDGRHLALFDQGGLFIYDTHREKFRTHLPMPEAINGDGLLSPDGSLFVGSIDANFAYVVYDLFQEKVLFQVEGAGLAFLDNRYLAVAQSGRAAIDIWDCYRKAPVGTVEAGQELIRRLVAHPGSGRLLSIDGKGHLLFWQLKNETIGRDGDMLIQSFPLRPPHRDFNVLSLLFEGILPIESYRSDPG